MSNKNSGIESTDIPTEKALNVLFTEDVLNAEGKLSSSGKSRLVSFNNFRFRARLADGQVYEFFGNIPLNRTLDPVEDKPAARKTAAAIIS